MYRYLATYQIKYTENVWFTCDPNFTCFWIANFYASHPSNPILSLQWIKSWYPWISPPCHSRVAHGRTPANGLSNPRRPKKTHGCSPPLPMCRDTLKAEKNKTINEITLLWGVPTESMYTSWRFFTSYTWQNEGCVRRTWYINMHDKQHQRATCVFCVCVCSNYTLSI